MYFRKAVFSANNEAMEVELICNKCGKIIKIDNMNIFSRVQSDYCVTIQEIVCECGNITKPGIIEFKKNISLEKAIIIKKAPQLNAPKCPTCGSTNIEKITATSKAIGAMAFGLFSKTAKSQFKCKNCGYKW